MSGWYDIPEEEEKQSRKLKEYRDYKLREREFKRWECASRGHDWTDWEYESWSIPGMNVTEEEVYQREMMEAQRQEAERTDGKMYVRRCRHCDTRESERRRE